MATKCPNRGPGRYEGQTYPCIAALGDENREWSKEEIGDVETIGHVQFFDFIPEATEDLEGPCDSCAKGIQGAFGLGIFTDSFGFVGAEIYKTEQEYKAAVAYAEKAQTTFDAESEPEA